MKNEKLKKYINKIRTEAIIKSIIYGFIIGFSFFILLTLFLYIFKIKNFFLTILIGLITSGVVSYLIYKYKFKPSINNVAKRIDELGLQERIITMIEYEDRNDYIAKIQREDAIENLKKVEANEIKFKFSKMTFIILGLILVLSAFTFVLPNPNSDTSASNSFNTSSLVSSSNTSSSSSTSSIIEELDEDEIIQKLLDELREIIDKAGIDKDVKDDLHAIVDQLEIDLSELDTLEEKIEAIEEKKQEIKDRIAYELLRMSLGRALKQYDMTYELGDAIYQEDLDKVDYAIDNLIFLLSTSENIEEDAITLANYLYAALEIADKEKNEALIEAVKNFADSLMAIVPNEEIMSFNPHKLLAGENGAEIIDAITQAGEEIKDALRKNEETVEPEQGEQTEDEVQDTGDQMDSAMDEALDDLQQIINQTKDPNQNENGNEDDEGETPPPVFDNSDIESETVINGETPYLDVYDEYFEIIKGWLESGEEIPDEYKELVERYLDMIRE